MTKQKTTKVSEPKAKRNINVKGMCNQAQAWAAQAILAGLAFVGAQSLVDASETIKTGFGILIVVLLVQVANKR